MVAILGPTRPGYASAAKSTPISISANRTNPSARFFAAHRDGTSRRLLRAKTEGRFDRNRAPDRRAASHGGIDLPVDRQHRVRDEGERQGDPVAAAGEAGRVKG